MCSETKGEASSFHFNMNLLTLGLFAFIFCAPLSQVGDLVVYVRDAVWDSVQLYVVEGALCYAVCRDGGTGNPRHCKRHTLLRSGS